MSKGLIALAVGTFALGISEFGMMGILGDVATGLNISIVKAGHFIAAYSLGVAIGAPLLIIFRHLPLKRLMLILAGLIAVGNLIAALASDYNVLLSARFISGLPHGAFFGAGSIVSTKLAATGRGAESVATMVGGMTVANVIGVPLATFLSNIFTWRIAFMSVSAFGLLSVILITLFIPYLSPLPDSGLKGQFRFLRTKAPWLIYAGVFFAQGSVYCWFSYIDPIMTEVTKFSTDDMTWIMMIAGIGMVAGNYVSGRLSDRYNAAKITGITASLLAIIMLSVYFCSKLQIPSIILMFMATAGLFGVGGPLQYLIVKYAEGGEMLGGAGIQIAFNVSNAVSASIGGLAIHHGLGLASPALVGVPLAIIGALALFTLYHKYNTPN